MNIKNAAKKLLPRLKQNLIIEDGSEDAFLTELILSALDYAQRYQNLDYSCNGFKSLPEITKQAVIMLATHFYESRDAATGGYFADTALAGANAREAIERMLSLHKIWRI